MRWPRTLSWYVAREILLFGMLGLVGVTTLLLSQQLLERLHVLVSIGLDASAYAEVLALILALVTPYVLPIAFALGVTLTVARLATNNEILAIRACGLGLPVLLVPSCAIAIAIGAGSGLLVRDVEPTSRLALRQLLADAALAGAIVQPRRFRGMRDRTVFVEERSKDDELRRVMVVDRTDADRPFAVFARTGRTDYDSESGLLSLNLRDGQIVLDPDANEPDAVRTLRFDAFTYSFDALSLLRGRYHRRNVDELRIDELYETIRRIDAGEALWTVRRPERELYELEIQRRYAMAFAPLAFALVAVPLGMVSRRGARTMGVLGCAVVVTGYYGLITLGHVLGRDGTIDTVTASWTPNVILLAAAMPLLLRARRGDA